MCLKRLVWATTLTLVAIVVCYYFIDKPAAEYAATVNFRQYPVFSWFASTPVYISYLTAIFVVVSIFCLVWERRIHKWMMCSILVAVSLMLSTIAKNILKFVFGRYWPATWKDANPSWLDNHEYGFHPFHTGVWYQSFPSGHATAILASMTVIGLFYPKLRSIALFLVAITLVGQLAMYYHFVSDLIAGAYLGALFGFSTVHLARRHPIYHHVVTR
ncbi:phosphatase PAP2 family protein [Vibrio sp. S4M6]|uniref:phosphatase PAP2 family protein n=1 Tax=Vibrio sinus TaxID=2946865 RepID=UPI00202A75C5|nr:phosphatase PAP2 family protein [Vibrio sinus]MCL9783064.1 phosphatase PAP2 family protein [Vibrio sinus]